MTALRNFDTILDQQGVTSIVTSAPAVVETVKVTRRPSQARTHLLADEGEWGWRELRDYVVTQIEARTGPFPRDSKKEYGIFNSFVLRWGARSAEIARHVFEIHEGMWNGQSVTVNRFCKASDPYFAQPIVDRLDSIR